MAPFFHLRPFKNRKRKEKQLNRFDGRWMEVGPEGNTIARMESVSVSRSMEGSITVASKRMEGWIIVLPRTNL
jgi:hypothetical protein